MTEIKKSRSELKRDAIVDAAKFAFEEYGAQATSMDKLAEIAQVSKRTVYNHFANKEELVMHLITELWQRTMLDNPLTYRADLPLDSQLLTLVSDEINLIGSQEYIDLARVAFGHFFYHPEELQKQIEKFTAQETKLQRWIKSAADDGRLNITNIEFDVAQLHNLVKGSCFWPQMLKIAPLLTNTEKQYLAQKTVAIFLNYYQVS